MSSSSQRGFTMALALAMAVIMGIMLMKIAPAVDAQVQRENESELIFRGEAIANALRIYAAKMHRYPKDLDEIMKIRPRILRQKYLDPMTPDGEWVPITQVQPGVTGDTTGLPMVGVHSRSEKDSIHIYQGKTLVRDWRFTADQNILGVGGGPGQGAPVKGGIIPGGGIVPGGGDAKSSSDSGKS
jgi:type II secretory pathway pseudopilin PulG